MRLCIVWSLSECAATHQPSTMSVDEQQRVRARWRSFVVSSALWRERSSAISAAPTGLLRRSLWPLDLYRSINSVVETFFKALKSELVWRTVFQTRAEAKAAIGRYIDGFYNPVRRHSTLDYVSPVQFERLAE